MVFRDYVLIDKPDLTEEEKKYRLTKKQFDRLVELSVVKGKSKEEISEKMKKPLHLIELFETGDVTTIGYLHKKAEEDLEKMEDVSDMFKFIRHQERLTDSAKKDLRDIVIRIPRSEARYKDYVGQTIESAFVGFSGIKGIQNRVWSDNILLYRHKKALYDGLRRLAKDGIKMIYLIVKVQKDYKRKSFRKDRNGKKTIKQKGSVYIETTVRDILCYDLNQTLPQIVIDINFWLSELKVLHLVNNGIGYSIEDVKISDTALTGTPEVIFTKEPIIKGSYSTSCVIMSDGKSYGYDNVIEIDLKDQLKRAIIEEFV